MRVLRPSVNKSVRLAAFPFGISDIPNPGLRFFLELIDAHSGQTGARILSRSALESVATASRLPVRTVLKGSVFVSSGFTFTTSGSGQRSARPGVRWLLKSRRPVLVERPNSLGLWHKVRTAPLRRHANEIDDSFLARVSLQEGRRIVGASAARPARPATIAATELLNKSLRVFSMGAPVLMLSVSCLS